MNQKGLKRPPPCLDDISIGMITVTPRTVEVAPLPPPIADRGCIAIYTSKTLPVAFCLTRYVKLVLWVNRLWYGAPHVTTLRIFEFTLPVACACLRRKRLPFWKALKSMPRTGVCGGGALVSCTAVVVLP